MTNVTVTNVTVMNELRSLIAGHGLAAVLAELARYGAERATAAAGGADAEAWDQLHAALDALADAVAQTGLV